MKNAIALVLSLPVLLSSIAVSLAGMPEFDRYLAVQDSLSRVPPKWRAEWLERRGLDASRYTEYRKPESTGLRLVGKYGRGPSVEVTGRGSLVALTLGSEVALLDCSNPHNPQVLSEIQLGFLPRQTALHDSFLLTCGNGIEVWNIADPTQPVFRSVIPKGVSDFSVVDSFLYFTSKDTFWSYSIGSPASPRVLGFCRDSGYVTTATRNTAILRQPGDKLGFVDVTDPAAPRQVGTYPGWAISVEARGNICCVTIGNPSQPTTLILRILDISDPATPVQIASLDSCGGYDMHLAGQYLFISGYYTGGHEFRILDIADSTNPVPRGRRSTLGQNFGVWADPGLNMAYVADDAWGLNVIDVADIGNPTTDTVVMRADYAQDVSVDRDYAYVANWRAGLRVLDVTDATEPHEVGAVDTIKSTSTYCVVARDSFAYIGWSEPPFLRTVSVADPSHPTMAGGCQTFEWPRDMVLRDSFIYAAMPYRFQIVNVAHPRQPVLVGSCVTQDGVSFGLAVQDSFAFIISGQLQIVNIARRNAPFIVSTTRGGASGIVVRDTFAYIPHAYDTLWVYSVADPVQPRLLSSVPTSVWPRDVALGESTLYVGTSDGWGVDVFDITNPGQPVRIGRASAPHDIRRLHYEGGRLYAAMWEAGVAVYETTTTGLGESSAPRRVAGPLLEVRPTLTRGTLAVRPMGNVVSPIAVSIWDAAGRAAVPAQDITTQGPLSLDLTLLPRGVYWLKAETGSRNQVVKVVKQ